MPDETREANRTARGGFRDFRVWGLGNEKTGVRLHRGELEGSLYTHYGVSFMLLGFNLQIQVSY